jgi:formate-dependent phosphoribosylglycinamide formyltransferase (GAR transformylase)
MTLPTGSTIGILGGGQLGRMLALAAAQLGYRCHIYAPEASGPATEVSAAWTQAAYDDVASLDAFAAAVDVVTFEFENIDPRAVAHLANRVEVSPSPASLEAAQYRPNEKALVEALGGATAPYRLVSDRAALEAAIADLGTPAILKTTRFGYDGKGQARVDAPGGADAAWQAIGAPARSCRRRARRSWSAASPSRQIFRAALPRRRTARSRSGTRRATSMSTASWIARSSPPATSSRHRLARRSRWPAPLPSGWATSAC